MRRMTMKQRMARWQWWVSLPLMLLLCVPFASFWILAAPFRLAGLIGAALNWISVELNYSFGRWFKWLLKFAQGK